MSLGLRDFVFVYRNLLYKLFAANVISGFAQTQHFEIPGFSRVSESYFGKYVKIFEVTYTWLTSQLAIC